jgi:hypothetical protein
MPRDYTLRPHLSQSYKNTTLKKNIYQSMDDLFDQLKARPTPKMVNLIYYLIIIHMLKLYNFSKVMMDQR